MKNNEEILKEYKDKLIWCKNKFTQVQKIYTNLNKNYDSLEEEIKIQGCKIMIVNLTEHIKKCKKQIRKHEKIIKENL